MSAGGPNIRERAARVLDVTMALEAGAGSGKTTVLVDRIVELLARGVVEPRALAAITFTEKAAGELSARVRDALELRRARSLGPPEASPGAERKALEAALERFGDLTLSTIHGFCRELLAHEALEASFAPGTSIGDEAEEERLLGEALTGFRRQLRHDRPELSRFLERLVRRGALRDAALGLHRYRAYEDVAASAPLELEVAAARLRELAAELTVAEARCAAPGVCKLIASNRAFTDSIRRALEAASAGDHGPLVDLSTSDGGAKATGGTAKHWGPDGKEVYLAALRRVEAWRTDVQALAHGELVRLLRGSVLPAHERQKRVSSIAGFDDLLIEAAQLLTTSPGARRRLSARYRVILIDEVQDTDPVQAEVAALLTSPPSAGPWHAAIPQRGRLFAVGDPKQSIYRFRGADAGTFKRIQALVEAAGEKASLVENFRSVPGIVAWVNHTFAALPGYLAQRAHRSPALLDPVVSLEAGEPEREIDAVLRHLSSLLASGARVIDRETGAARALRLSDVMLLLPSWRFADEIADQLRAAGLECVVEGGDRFFDRDEVRLGVALLRVIVEPSDTEAAAFVLRGLFGLSHVELASHVARGGSLRPTIPDPPPGPVAAALERLASAHRRRGTKALASLLGDVLGASRAPAVWKLLPDGLSRLANLDKLTAMMREIEAEATSPFAAIEELTRRVRSIRAREKDVDRLDADGEAIRITSLFKAKGLEAPIVVLLHAARRPSNISTIVDHEARRIAVRLGGLQPPGWKELVEGERREEQEERRRWMYVAATRARDQLVVCRSGAARSLLDLDIAPRGLPPGAAAHGDTFEPSAGVTVRVLRAEGLPEVAASPQTFPGVDAEVARLLAEPPATSDLAGETRTREVRRRVRSARLAAIRWRAASEGEGGLRWVPGVPVDSAPLQGGARAGRVVHEVLERLDLSCSREELRPEAVTLGGLLSTRAGLGEGATAAVCATVLRILDDPILDEARAAPERWQEVPFTYAVRPGSIVAGTIDLCFPIDPERRRWVVVDWKATLPAAGSVLHDRYREQLARYARALLSNLGEVEIVKTALVGPHPELGPIEDPGEVLLDVPEHLRGELRELREAGAPIPELDVAVGESRPVTADVAWVGPRVAYFSTIDEVSRAALESEGWRIAESLSDAGALLGLVAPPEE